MTADGPPGDREARILVLVEREANRRQLVSWLSGAYAVETDPDGPVDEALARCDLCLVDEASFGRHRGALAAAREDAAPLLFPVALVLTGQSRNDVGAGVWDVVDDLIETPVRQAQLRGRMEVLLRARGYSVGLVRQNERLERFVDVVSHDLRNPLNVAMLHLDSATEECDSDHLGAVAGAHDRIEALISDLLTLAREGSAVTDTEWVALADLAGICWESVDTRGAELVVETDQTVRADRNRLRQLLENLFRNAVEHGGDVTVTVGGVDGGFSVADAGPGIPEEDRDRVFESGYSTRREGTGLGLSIVAEVAAAHGWRVSVTASESGGARFEVTGVETV